MNTEPKYQIWKGLLLVEVDHCTCGAGDPAHEPMCGLELMADITEALANSGYRQVTL